MDNSSTRNDYTCTLVNMVVMLNMLMGITLLVGVIMFKLI